MKHTLLFLLSFSIFSQEWHHINTDKISRRKCYTSRKQGYTVCRFQFNFVKIKNLCTFSEIATGAAFEVECDVFRDFEKRYYQILNEK